MTPEIYFRIDRCAYEDSGRSSGSSRRPECRRQKLGQPRQIIGGGHEGENPADPVANTEFGSRLSRHRLDPAEDPFDPFANALTYYSITGVARRAAVYGGRPPAR